MININKKYNVPILITGETGTGKTYLARKIARDEYGSENFVEINLSGLSNELFSSELFGHKKGAFTGAFDTKIGRCDLAKDGVLFLDEIGDISMEQQLRLLQFLDDKTYYALGDNNKKQFRGSIILATNKNLFDLVSKGLFRKDLLYRLLVFNHCLSPLRANRPLIKQILIDELGLDFRESMSESLYDFLLNYNYPGNIRELKNIILFLNYSQGNTPWDCSQLPDWIKYEQEGNSIDFIGNSSKVYKKALEEFENAYFRKCLCRYGGKINLTSRKILVSKSTLIAKLRKYDIDRLSYKN